MSFTRSRKWATASLMLDDSSQKAPSAASEGVIRRMALTATRPARRRSRRASTRRNPNTALALVLDQSFVLDPERALLERGGQRRRVRGEQHRGAAGVDVAHDLDHLGRHALVEVAGRLV